MPAVNLCFIRQGKKLGLYAVHQRIKITTRQIGAAHTHIKQHIAADDETALFIIKRYTARRMTGGKPYLQFILPYFYFVPFF